MKTFVLTVSKTFPKTHKRAGESTGFVWDISKLFTSENTKIHAIRANYDLWVKRAQEINDGRAILSIRYWSHKTYCSKQVEICRLIKIGVQKLEDPTSFDFASIDGKTINWTEVAKNDGLSFVDFREWFKVRKNSQMAVIHFTEYRY